jgi:hypothetical protein
MLFFTELDQNPIWNPTWTSDFGMELELGIGIPNWNLELGIQEIGIIPIS